jgi:hypothetical protein
MSDVFTPVVSTHEVELITFYPGDESTFSFTPKNSTMLYTIWNGKKDNRTTLKFNGQTVTKIEFLAWAAESDNLKVTITQQPEQYDLISLAEFVSS